MHRDAENQNPEVRYTEIRAANPTGSRHVCIVPVRMQEAWLLLNEAALREAADRPSGTDPLDLPPVGRWERVPDPKATRKALQASKGGPQVGGIDYRLVSVAATASIRTT